MTRFARGGPANKKKLHEATEWKTMVQHPQNDQQKHGSKRKCEEIAQSSIAMSKVKPNKKARKIKPKLLGNVGLDLKNPDTTKQEDTVSFLTNAGNAAGGLAAELEKLNTPKTGEKYEAETFDPQNHKGKKHRHNSTKVGCNNEQLNTKKEKVLKTELTEYLSDLKRDSVLDESESKEVEELIKKDQRREKRRIKRIDKKAEGKTCYNCRQSGHTVADCTEKSVQQHGTGICFKCGSTEHNMTRCRVKLPAGKYPYAKCFICSEQGHLSNQCPDNPRGLYPSGGCCGTCGSVEHFRKDCPELQKERGINSFTIERMTSSFDNVEKDPFLGHKFRVKKQQPKVIKF